jgi:Phage integrase, N-terminal SAM-like domain
MPGKRRFGRVRELPSGRWQARYKGPDGIDRPAPRTFDSKTSAERWLTLTEAEIIQGDWIDPDAGRVLFGNYARDWIEERPNLRPKTIQLYLYLLRSHLAPAFSARAMADIRAMAEEPARRAGQRSHRGQGVPAAQSDLQHGGR